MSSNFYPRHTNSLYNAMVTCKIFQCFISHVTTSETKIKITAATEGVLQLFQNYWIDNEHAGKYS